MISMKVPVTQPVLSVSGSGSKTIARFAFHGRISAGVSCTGKGNLNLEFFSSAALPGLGVNCPETGDGIGPGPGSGNGDHRTEIKIDAPAHVHWTLTARETETLTLTAPAKVQQLPIRRHGVGSTLLGVVVGRGSIYVKAWCLGTGTFAVDLGSSETSAACPNSLKQPAAIEGESSTGTSQPYRARIWVRAPAGMRWTLEAAAGRVP